MEEYYNRLLISRSKNVDNIRKALDIVKKYITDNDRILYGGISIDYYMRIHGKELYKDFILPDYDFYSPEYIKDGYSIAEILHNAGIENIDVIQARHVTTVRVRIDSEVVADITYYPEKDYKSLNFLNYKEFIIIDEYMILCNLIKTLSIMIITSPPNEPFFRFNKDSDRFDSVNNLVFKNYIPKNAKVKKESYIIDLKDKLIDDKQLLLTGEAAVNAIIHCYTMIVKKLKLKSVIDIEDHIINIDNKDEISLELVDKPMFCSTNDDIIKKEQSASFHNNVYELLPKSYEFEQYIVYIYNDLPLFYNDLSIFGINLKICSAPIVMFHILCMINIETGKKREYFISLYHKMNKMIKHINRR